MGAPLAGRSPGGMSRPVLRLPAALPSSSGWISPGLIGRARQMGAPLTGRSPGTPTVVGRYLLAMTLRRWSLFLSLALACGDPNDPAARAVSVEVLTATRSLLAGDTITLAAQARDAEGRGVPEVPFTWASGDPTRLVVVDATAGVITAVPARGTAYARVMLPSGAADSVAIRVQPRPVSVEVVSGDQQQGIMNNPLRDPVVVRAVADDGLGVEGVIVAFRPATGSGAPSDAQRASDSLGRARVQWTLGTDATQHLDAITLLPESLAVALSAVALVPGVWTWVGGDSTTGVLPRYGTRGVPDSNNTPGGRSGATFAVADDGTVWLFGGRIGAAVRNDLWRLQDGVWTWIAGSDQPDPPGTFGVKGVPDPNSMPAGRLGGVGWVDDRGDLWLFGGNMAAFEHKRADDLWRFDGSQWTWMAGDSTANRAPSYGERGVAHQNNTPGARSEMGASWTDAQGRRWLFGSDGTHAGRGDLWRHDDEGWSWVGGDTTLGRWPRFGELGMPAPENSPGTRGSAAAWTTTGSLWLLGGSGLNAAVVEVTMGDLWRFNGSEWAWVGGSQNGRSAGTYGSQGAADFGNWIGARVGHASASSNEVAWVFGGIAFDANGSPGRMNDLWRFDGSRWTWFAGSKELPLGLSRMEGRWGMRGIGDPANAPSGRTRSVMWVDANGTLWLYGGEGHNDLWRYDLTRLP